MEGQQTHKHTGETNVLCEKDKIGFDVQWLQASESWENASGSGLSEEGLRGILEQQHLGGKNCQALAGGVSEQESEGWCDHRTMV